LIEISALVLLWSSYGTSYEDSVPSFKTDVSNTKYMLTNINVY